jgi:integrase
MALTDVQVRNAKPGPKRRRLWDGHGLYLEIPPSGSKRWRFKYRFPKGGKEKLLSLGIYPAVSLKQAREKREEAKELLATGIDPSAHRQALKQAAARTYAERAANSFEVVAREWFARYSGSWVESHASRILRRFERDLFPWIGSRPVAEITPPELLASLRRIEDRGAVETAHRAKSDCGQVFRYAIATGRAERDPSQDLRGALPPAIPSHHPSITDPAALGALLRAIDGYDGYLVTKCALRLAPLLFVRPGELRHAFWAEIHLAAGEWRIPAAKMKAREMHLVPLARQALGILSELHPLTGSGPYVFPSVRSSSRPMSENTVNGALRRLGYGKDEMTGHGFRSIASTLLNEQGWHRDAIERQLAHAERNGVRAAYNYAEHLPERRKMMQAWADYLDQLKAGASGKATAAA